MNRQDDKRGRTRRILALVTDGFGAGGGIAHYNQDLLTALSGGGTAARIVVVPRFGEGDTTVPTGVFQVRPARSAVAWSVEAARRAICGGFDAVFCGHLFASPLAAILARWARIPLWLQVHGIEAWEPHGRAVDMALAQARLITSVSRYTRTRLLGWSDVDPAIVRVLPNTVDARFSRGTRSVKLLRALGLDGRRIILTVSRLASSERYKGHDRIIAALPDVIARVSDTVYVVAGDGDDRDRLEALAASTGVAAHVRFIGRQAADMLPDLYRSADLFCMPSTGEGFGIVFLEAAACGLPVIGGNRDGSIDALADGAIGRIVDPLDTAQLAAAMVDALTGGNAPDDAAVGRFDFTRFSRHVDDLVRHYL